MSGKREEPEAEQSVFLEKAVVSSGEETIENEEVLEKKLVIDEVMVYLWCMKQQLKQ